MNRRTFVSSLAAAGAVAALPNRLMGVVGRRPRVGLIGCGWFGNVNLDSMAKVAELDIVSLCDPNKRMLASTLDSVKAKQSKVPDTFADYRKMLASNEHDIVIVGTPDHWHALPAIEAMQAGADVFLEKPIGVDVLEGEALVTAARKYDRVVQVNLQRRRDPIFDEVREQYLDTERLGKIGLVECYYYGGGNGDVVAPVSVPEHLDYDLWAGPAEKVPYVPQIESRGWRMFQEYGNGTIGDMGVHIFDLVRSVMGLGWPDSISSTGGRFVYKNATSNISDTQKTVFHYPDMDVSWEHRHWGASPIPQRHWTDQWGARIVGERGTLNLTTMSYALQEQGSSRLEGRHLLSRTNDLENLDFDRFNAVVGGNQDGHCLDFLTARETRSRPLSDIEEGHISSACCILGNVALDLGRPIAYDPKTRKVADDAEATSRLARSYRGDWTHPDPAKV
ncbi:Gfo/Idh/MocA family oxidoreductase [Pelagicoccus sp. SDUM812002]|uniref:Gfo/Idh/MocA family protein n=1 Tax=Pelagicoccus sp. SDUM812002 TaxID=3041266 RepID=UPI00280D344B|nr:Gfo/Idh/MocA family oxidoreductase [Pelagicoccus sp. SDUM812002]MDQ8188049.1 Gfo/Idh/MocA family oxidoreductase [Pelagicoccus sp. SDUM812002]